MAEIEDLPQASFALVARHNARLRTNAPRNSPIERFAVAPEQPIQPPLEKPEKRSVTNDSILHRFVQPGAILTFGEAREQVGIDQDQFRRIERADEVLPFPEIYARLPANRAIDLRDKRGGNVHQAHPAQVRRRNKSDNVSYNASADSDQDRFAIRASAHEAPAKVFDGAKILRRFAIIEENQPGRSGTRKLVWQAAATRAPDTRR